MLADVRDLVNVVVVFFILN